MLMDFSMSSKISIFFDYPPLSVAGGGEVKDRDQETLATTHTDYYGGDGILGAAFLKDYSSTSGMNVPQAQLPPRYNNYTIKKNAAHSTPPR
jgi:hypothetical protein